MNNISFICECGIEFFDCDKVDKTWVEDGSMDSVSLLDVYRCPKCFKVMNMSFEEDYADVWDEEKGMFRCENHGLYLYDEGWMHTCKLGCVYTHRHEDVHNHYLDKQLVREAIIEECDVHCRECELPEEIKERLLKRLKL